MPPHLLRRAVAAGALLLALALPSAAAADSIAYVKEGDIWLASTDGATQRQLTREGDWTGVSQSDNGVIVGAKERRLFALSNTGAVRNEIVTGMQSLNWNGPYDIAVSPDGKRVAYGFLYQRVVVDPDCPLSPSQCASTSVTSGVAYSDTTGPASGVEAHTGWSYPAWVSDSLLMHSDPDGVLNEDVILRAFGSPNNEGDQWFTADQIPRLRDGEVRRNVLAFIGGHSAEVMTVWRTPGAPDAATPPEGCLAYGQPTGKFAGPSLSPDARTLVWAEDDGIWSAPLPDLSAGCSGSATNGRLIIPGGRNPDWGGAELPPIPGPETPTIAVARAKLGQALRSGLKVTLRGVTGPVRLTGTAGGRVVARGKGAGDAPVTLRFTKAGAKRLAKARTVKLTVAVDGRSLRRTITLRRAGSATAAVAQKEKGGMWRVTSVDVQGTYERFHNDLETYNYEFSGKTSYVGGRSRKPFAMKLSLRKPQVILARPVRYSGASTVKWEWTEDTKTHSVDCSLTMPETTGGFAGVLFTRPSGVTVQWSIAPVGQKCPEDLPSLPPEFPPLPQKAMIERYELKRFFGKTATLPISIDYEKGSRLAGEYEHITWTGSVRIKRLA